MSKQLAPTKPIRYDSAVPLDTDKIKKLRESLELTQQQAADRANTVKGEDGKPMAGFDRFRWAAIETGKRANVTIATLDQMAKALGVRAKDLLK